MRTHTHTVMHLELVEASLQVAQVSEDLSAEGGDAASGVARGAAQTNARVAHATPRQTLRPHCQLIVRAALTRTAKALQYQITC